MRVALGVLNKEIERLQQEVDSMSTIQSNPAKYARLTSEIEELLEAWQVLKDWSIKRREREQIIKFNQALYGKDSNGKFKSCVCVPSHPKDVKLCDECPGNVVGNPYRSDLKEEKPLHDPTTYTQAEKPKFPEDRTEKRN